MNHIYRHIYNTAVIIVHYSKFQLSDPACRHSPRWDRDMHSPWSCNKVHIQRWRSFLAVPSTNGPWKSPGPSNAVGNGEALGSRSWIPCGWVNHSRTMRRWRMRRRRMSEENDCCGPLGWTACRANSDLRLMTIHGWRSEVGLESDSFVHWAVAVDAADVGSDAEGAGCLGRCYKLVWCPKIDDVGSCNYRCSGSASGQNTDQLL